MDERKRLRGARARAYRALAALALLAPLAAAGAPAFPLRARVLVAPAALEARFVPPPPESAVLLVPGGPVEVGLQGRNALILATSRLFEPAGTGEADLDIELVDVVAGATWDGEGWRLRTEHTVVVRAADGTELARWRPTGEARPASETAGGVTVGFARAAVSTAAAFEYALPLQPGVAAFLRSRGIDPAGTARVPPEPLPQPAHAGPRAPTNAFWTFGFGYTPGAGEGAFVAAGRAGVAGPLLLLQVASQYWRPGSRILGYNKADPWVVSLGLEAGIERSIGRSFSFRAGLGPQAVFGSTMYDTISNRGPVTAIAIGLGAFAAIEYSRRSTSTGAGIRLGVEVRELWNDGLKFPSNSPYSCCVSNSPYGVSGWTTFVTVGGEWPWRGWPSPPTPR